MLGNFLSTGLWFFILLCSYSSPWHSFGLGQLVVLWTIHMHVLGVSMGKGPLSKNQFTWGHPVWKLRVFNVIEIGYSVPAGLCAWNECKPCLIYLFGQSLWDQKCSEKATMEATRVLIYSKKKKNLQWVIVREWKEVRRNWEVKWGEKNVSLKHPLPVHALCST